MRFKQGTYEKHLGKLAVVICRAVNLVPCSLHLNKIPICSCSDFISVFFFACQNYGHGSLFFLYATYVVGVGEWG